MPANATHIIRRQYYQLKVTTQQQGRAMQRQLQEFNLQQLLPALNTRFNQWFGEDEVVTIDKLEIDLGTIHSSASDNEWLEKIIDKITAKLEPAQSVSIESEVESITIEKKDGIVHALEVLIYFLRNGLLPNSIYQNIESVFNALHQPGAISEQAIKNELIKHVDDFVLQRLSLLSSEQAHFIIRLFVSGISLIEWNEWISDLNNKLDRLALQSKFIQQSTLR